MDGGQRDEGRAGRRVYSARRPAGLKSINGVKVFLFRAALWADPFVGQVGKGCSGLHAVFKVTLFRVVNVATGAFHLLHVDIS